MPIVQDYGTWLVGDCAIGRLLWGCLIGERVGRGGLSRNGPSSSRRLTDAARQRTQPVFAPAPFIHHRARVAAG